MLNFLETLFIGAVILFLIILFLIFLTYASIIDTNSRIAFWATVILLVLSYILGSLFRWILQI